MTLLVLGLALFVGGHLVPAVPGLKRALIARLGPMAFKGIVSLPVLAGLVLVVVAWPDAPRDLVHAPPPWARHLAWTAVPLAFVLLASAYVPSRIGWFLGHPMSLAVLVWGTVHAAANHELRSIVLFGGLAAWGLVGWLGAAFRDGFRPKPRPEAPRDVQAVLGGLLTAAVVAAVHQAAFGVSVLP